MWIPSIRRLLEEELGAISVAALTTYMADRLIAASKLLVVVVPEIYPVSLRFNNFLLSRLANVRNWLSSTMNHLHAGIKGGQGGGLDSQRNICSLAHNL